MLTENSVSSVQKKKIVLNEKINLPKGVSAILEDGKLTLTGPLGKVTQEFSKIPVSVSLDTGSIQVSSLGARRKNRSIIKTTSSIVQNAIRGVTEGYQFKLKVIFAHFPVTVKVQGKRVFVENFYGERSPRTADIIGDCKVEVQGEDVVVSGVSVQDVGQTAANIEQATTLRRKDQRVFLDGVYIYERVTGKK